MDGDNDKGFEIKYYENLEEAKADAAAFDYALLYYPDRIRLIRARSLNAADWQGCVEARIFRKDGEIHFFSDEGEKAVRVSDTGRGAVLEKEYKLAGSFRVDGRKAVRVIEYLDTDGDGQSRIVLSRLSELI